MGVKKKTHVNKKADQETQSPVIKVFKEIMQLSENANSEKANLLKQKPKKKRLFGSKPKDVQSAESTASERHHKVINQQRPSNNPLKSQSIFHGEKRDSWWAWGEPETEKNAEDSCVSCALTKLLTSQRSCVLLCIAAILAISGGVAIFCVMTSVPKSCFENIKSAEDLQHEEESTSLPEGEKRDRRSEYSYVRKRMEDGSIWDANKARLMAELNSPELSDTRADGENVQSRGRINSELSSIIDSNKLGEGYRSRAVRDFYQKLIKTDLEISKLKKTIRNTKTLMTVDGEDMLGENFRPKRSLQYLNSRPKKRNGVPIELDTSMFRNLNVYFPPAVAVETTQKAKRQVEWDDGPADVLLQDRKKKAMPFKSRLWGMVSKNRKVEESTTQDPFPHTYSKNSEKLDELLNKLIDKNAPDVPFTLHYFKAQISKKIKQKTTVQQHNRTNSEEQELVTPVNDNEFEKHQRNKKKLKKSKYKEQLKRLDLVNAIAPWRRTSTREDVITLGDSEGLINTEETTPHGFNGALSISTILISPVRQSVDDHIQGPNLRRLLQLEGGEDIEDTETVEDADKNGDDKDINKRTELQNTELDMRGLDLKQHLPDINNPNWKGPMPLYPDELNTIIKNSVLANLHINKGSVSDNAKDLSDTEYVEDYVANKYDKLVKMAQAYSDYGVLENKKEIRHETNTKHLDNKVGLSATALRRRKKSKTACSPDKRHGEGSRFEITKKRKTRTKPGRKLFHLENHLKIDSNKKAPMTPFITNSEYYEPPKVLTSDKVINFPTDFPTFHNDSWNPFGNSYKRSIKSVIDDANDDEIDNVAVIDYTEDEIKTAKFYHNDIKNMISASTKPIQAGGATIGYVFSRTDDNEKLPSNSYDIDSINTKNVDYCMNDNANYINNVVSNKTETHKFSNFMGDLFQMLNNLNVNGKASRNENSTFQQNEINLKLTEPLPFKRLDMSTTSKFSSPILNTKTPNVTANFGYKSRVLMSVNEEKIDNMTEVADVSEHNEEIQNDVKPIGVTDKYLNATTKTYKVNVSTEDNNLTIAVAEDKTVVKRSVDDNSNQIFWSDMYDEEYGVKDPLENAIREKPTDKSKDIMTKSGNWLGVKFKKIGDRMRHSYGKMMTPESPDGGKRNKVSKRANVDTIFGENQTFKSLNAKMQMVCKEAAEAVHKTKNMEVHSETAQAQTLMQQLVGMMSDLVDVQVKKRTCVVLPDDLRSFLVWLTSVNVEESLQGMPNVYQSNTFTLNSEGLQRPSVEVYPDVRTECLGTIHDLQQLIEMYDGMSEEDKSKMSGVREYLENQLDFLHKQLSAFDGYGFQARYYDLPIRRRRKLPKDTMKSKRIKRRIHKFDKNFGRKRTKSTVSEEPFDSLTDSYKNEDQFGKKDEGHSRKIYKYGGKRYSKNVKDDIAEDDEAKGKDKMKRNLQDIYYRALAEAKNATTARSVNVRTNY